jgi:hypothetical protein
VCVITVIVYVCVEGGGGVVGEGGGVGSVRCVPVDVWIHRRWACCIHVHVCGTW